MEYEHNVERIPYDKTSLEEFQALAEKKCKPILITNCQNDFENNFNFSFKV